MYKVEREDKIVSIAFTKVFRTARSLHEGNTPSSEMEIKLLYLILKTRIQKSITKFKVTDMD